jgi:hypothetical protein
LVAFDLRSRGSISFMTFARLLLEIRRRAAALPDGGQRAETLQRIAREVLADIPEGEQAGQVRRVLAAFLGLGEGDEFDATLLGQLTPELVLRLDMIASQLLELGRTNEVVRALREVLVRPAN